jgi:hypothetical protein
MRMPQCHTFKARREQRRLASIVIAPVMLALSCSLEANIVLRNEVHKFRCGVGNNAVRILAAFVRRQLFELLSISSFYCHFRFPYSERDESLPRSKAIVMPTDEMFGLRRSFAPNQYLSRFDRGLHRFT